MKNLIIIGGGPSALILASEIDTSKYKVTLYDQKKTVGRKFLVAGEGGLNLTYDSSIKDLIEKYVPSKFMESVLETFNNQDLRHWFLELGVPTFSGSSRRVFPEKGIKPIEVLTKIVNRIKEKGVRFNLNNAWLGWNDDSDLIFENGENINPDIVVFALGGASWSITGSDGSWKTKFEEKGINVNPFRSANCAFKVGWSKDFIKIYEGKPLKNIALYFKEAGSKGEVVITNFGLEGNAIYALSKEIQDSFLTQKEVVVQIDLKPTLTLEQVEKKLLDSKKDKITAILNQDLKLDKAAIALLKKLTTRDEFFDKGLLAKKIKSLPITLLDAAPIDKAISTLGGIDLDEVNLNLELKKLPHNFVIGEMLDWFAPTGGYLLQASFSMGYHVAQHLNRLG